jgi:hypothetical protein
MCNFNMYFYETLLRFSMLLLHFSMLRPLVVVPFFLVRGTDYVRRIVETNVDRSLKCSY